MSEAAQASPRRARFAPAGLLALAPSALGQVYDVTAPAPTSAPMPDVAVVAIRGPLVHHRTLAQVGSQVVDVGDFDSYEAIRDRVAAALATQAQCVVLLIDSPGGLVAGCFELAADLQEMASNAGKSLHCHIDGVAGSAAYALACACSTISAVATSVAGSIGVLDCVVDATAADQAMGLNWEIITSGPRKADGNPHTKLSPETVEAMQLRVDDLAAVFFDFVAASRGMTADAVKALNADTFVGARAKDMGLVDTIGTFSAQVADLCGPSLARIRQHAARNPAGAVAQMLPELETLRAQTIQRRAERAAEARAAEARTRAAEARTRAAEARTRAAAEARAQASRAFDATFTAAIEQRGKQAAALMWARLDKDPELRQRLMIEPRAAFVRDAGERALKAHRPEKTT